MRIYLSFLFLMVDFRGLAVDQITGTISVSNNPSGPANSITINGSTRTWTNSITSSPSTLIKETNNVANATTNLLNHLATYPPTAGGILGQSQSTNVYIKALPGSALSITIAGGWATVSFVTNPVTAAVAVRVPISVEAATNQTNIASQIVTAINLSTNALATNAPAGSNYITKGATVGPQHITSELRLSGNLNNGTGSLSTSNLVNAGNSFRSPGSGGNSLQIGSNAVASGTLSAAFGNGTISSNTSSFIAGHGARSLGDSSAAFGNSTVAGYQAAAFGQSASAAGPSSSAFGAGAFAGTNAGGSTVAGASATAFYNPLGRHGYAVSAFGPGTRASDTNAAAFGAGAISDYKNSTAIGPGATTTADNQVMLGTSSETVDVPGVLAPSGTITNATFKGTNVINGRLDFKSGARATLANGYNSGTILGTNVYLRMSGPSAAYTNAGFAAAADGTFHILQLDNPGLSYTILPESGLEATAANRILTGTGALANSTNHPAILQLLYDGTASRWRVISFR